MSGKKLLNDLNTMHQWRKAERRQTTSDDSSETPGRWNAYGILAEFA